MSDLCDPAIVEWPNHDSSSHPAAKMMPSQNRKFTSLALMGLPSLWEAFTPTLRLSGLTQKGAGCGEYRQAAGASAAAETRPAARYQHRHAAGAASQSLVVVGELTRKPLNMNST